MTINNNGSDHDVYCQQAIIGWGPGTSGEVLVDGNEATWNSPAQLSVGMSGSGALTILNGGTVSGGRQRWLGIGIDRHRDR